ncbi:MAG TPA: hypothetical protein VMS56_14450 [Thermoanaerobaculia bacterium]|nr:hypothetical protein [Thermoanaerobaculia bacterium]
MRISALPFVLAIAIGSGAAGAPPPAAELVRLDEAFRIAERLGPRVWPDFTADEAPVLLLANEREYLLNTPGGAEGFEPVNARFRGRGVFARAKVFPPGLEASFPAIGRECVVIGTAEATGKSGARWTLIVLHELFHVFQAEHLGLGERVSKLSIAKDPSGQWQLDHPFPYREPSIGRALHVVGYGLFRTLESSADRAYQAEVAAESLETLLDLLAALHPDEGHGEYLRFAATKEGLARWFEYRIAREAAAAWEPSPRFSELEGADAFARVWEESYAALPNQIKHLGRVSRSRSEFYNLGLGLALVLDQIDPAWQARLSDAWLDRAFLDSVAAARPAASP